jgi:hypothetical protein
MNDYECTKCGCSFKRKENLTYHVNRKVCIGGDKTETNHMCKYCDKRFTTATSMYRHMNHTCKVKKNETNHRDEIFERLVQLENENKSLKKQIVSMEEKINIDGNNLNHTMNNGVINHGKMNLTVNHNYIVGYGQEDHSMINRDELLQVFRSGFNSPLRLTETMHFNPKYPEFHNVYISSMKNKYAMMYDGNDWTLVMKDDLIDKLYDNKRDYIEENLDDFLESLTMSQRKALHRWMNAGDDHPYIEKIKNDIKLLLYNKRNLPLSNKLNSSITNVDDSSDIDRHKNVKAYKELKKNISQIKIKNTTNRPGTKRKTLKR